MNEWRIKMGVTTKDIARICNVSRTTVNRAFSNSGRISDETKQLILDTAKQLNYRPDLLATSLKNGKTKNIGVVVFDVKNQYFAQMVNAIESETGDRGYFLNIALHGKDKAKEREMLQKLVDYRVEGIILSPVSKDAAFCEFVNSLEKPVVIIGNRIIGPYPYVGIDEEGAAREAVRMIIKKQYDRIVFVCPPLADCEQENIYSHEQRKTGFLLEAQKQKADYEVIGSWDYLNRVRQMAADHKTAFFCSGDIYALEIMKHLREDGKKAGQDYGIMGFDNIDMLDYVIPRLATIDNEIEKVSAKAVEFLFDRIEGKEVPEEFIVPFHTVRGDTL